MKKSDFTRRSFISTAAVTGVAAALTTSAQGMTSLTSSPAQKIHPVLQDATTAAETFAAAKDHVFLYHAGGTALSGTVTSPFTKYISGTAGASLPQDGGYAYNEASNFSADGIVSFDKAYTQTSGVYSSSEGAHNSSVTICVEGLNVLDTLTADRIVMKLSSRHSVGASEGSITAVGSEVVNLQIAGKPVQVDFDHELFQECDTFAAFHERFQSDAAFRSRVNKQFLWDDFAEDAPQFLKSKYGWHTDKSTPPESKGLIPCNLVKKLTHDTNSMKSYGNVLFVPDFGTITFGDMVLKSGARQLTMLKVELNASIPVVRLGKGGGQEVSSTTTVTALLTISGGQQNGAGFP